MILSEQSAAFRRRLYDNRHWLPLLLYPAAILTLLIARPFNIIPDSFLFTLICAIISLTGVAIRALTVGYLPRRTEDEVTSIILYVGVGWFIVGAALLYTLFTYQILLCEEEELAKRFRDRYTLWASYTNALIPNRKLWISSRDRFSLMQVLRREYIGFFFLVLTFVTINLLRNRVIEFTWSLSPLWTVVGIATLLFTLFIRLIIKLINK